MDRLEAKAQLDVGDSRFRYEEPSLPLRVQEGPANRGISIPDEERELLLEFAAWSENPPFSEGGRSGVVGRKSSLIIDGTKVASYKLKGVANCDSSTGVISPPSSETYVRRMGILNGNSPSHEVMKMIPQILIHLGIDGNGDFRPILDPPKPLGGLNPGRGEREFNNAVKLHEAGVSACGPIAWGRYPDLLWNNEPMEFVILSLPTTDQRRMGAAFEPDV